MIIPPLQSDAEDAVQRAVHGGDAARLLPLRLDLRQVRQNELTPHRRAHALAVRILRVKYCSHFVYCFVDDSKWRRAFCGGRWGHQGFGLLRLLTGMGGMGCFMVSFVLAVEHVGYKFTMLVGIAIEIPFALGEAVLGVEAVLVRNWRDLQVLILVTRTF